MLSASEPRRFVSLRGGLVVPVEPLMLALDLESRGFRLQSDGSDLIVQPSSRLTPEDIQGLKRWKLHVVAIVNYTASDFHLFRGTH